MSVDRVMVHFTYTCGCDHTRPMLKKFYRMYAHIGAPRICAIHGYTESATQEIVGPYIGPRAEVNPITSEEMAKIKALYEAAKSPGAAPS